jgi:uncharacterized protein involved in tolerance to divalent cations
VIAGVKQGPRRSSNPLLEVPPDPRRREPIAEPPLPMRWATATADDIQQAVEEHRLAACQRTGRGHHASTMTWAPPISRHEVAGYAKLRRKQVARTQQRTRQIAPVLPQLLA